MNQDIKAIFVIIYSHSSSSWQHSPIFPYHSPIEGNEIIITTTITFNSLKAANQTELFDRTVLLIFPPSAPCKMKALLSTARKPIFQNPTESLAHMKSLTYETSTSSITARALDLSRPRNAEWRLSSLSTLIDPSPRSFPIHRHARNERPRVLLRSSAPKNAHHVDSQSPKRIYRPRSR